MPRNFTVQYNPQIHQDIQNQVDIYRKKTGNNEQGIRFVKTVRAALKELKPSALHYQIRYDDIRCLPIPVFPFMAHYRVDEGNKTVFVEAIFHTSENPEKWIER
jgi:hypothetical protein